MLGKTINGFTLQRLLGVGGMAEVWYAENEIGMKAAVKMLLPKLCADDSVKLRFINEAKVMVQLDHQNIRKVLGYGTIDERPAIIMEYLEGNDLKAMMKQGRRFTAEEYKRWWNQMVDALNYTHAEGIVHRDIKPSNIFIDKKGNVKLLDFGIAKVRESISVTQTGAMMGTLMYMSPEQVQDAKHLGPESDIYSLAVTFVHLITGRAPYDTTTSNDFQIREGIVYKPLDMTGVPDEWQSFLKPYLEKDPAKRPALRPFEASVKEAPTDAKANDLANVAVVAEVDEGTVAVEASKPKQPQIQKAPEPPKAETSSGGGKSRKGLWIGLAAVAVIALALVFLMKKPKENPVAFPPDPDTEAFQACQTVDDYRQYIIGYGHNAKHYHEADSVVRQYVVDSLAEVQERLAQHQANEKADAEQQEDEAYKKCVTIPTCDSYLYAYPNGRYVTEVTGKRAELVQQQAENEVKAKLAAAEAEAKLEEQKKEEAAFNGCTTIEACDNYLKTYPTGSYTQDVKEKKAELEAMIAQQEEDAVFNKCTTVAACDNYLNAYPKGRYVTEVNAKRVKLHKQAANGGVFSVSSSRKVYFAEGNLQYNPSTNKWRIALNPWDTIGCDNSNISPNYNGWIDLFCWGTGDDPTKSSKNRNDYPSFCDWGAKYGNGWRTLKLEEWKYLFSERDTQSGIRYAKASVNGINGLILLPDNWNSSTYRLRCTNQDAGYYSCNSISASTWSSVFAPVGAVFLPAAGRRDGTWVHSVGASGFYWSSSPYLSYFARYVGFFDGFHDSFEWCDRHCGQSVRLVRPAEN